MIRASVARRACALRSAACQARNRVSAAATRLALAVGRPRGAEAEPPPHLVDVGDQPVDRLGPGLQLSGRHPVGQGVDEIAEACGWSADDGPPASLLEEPLGRAGRSRRSSIEAESRHRPSSGSRTGACRAARGAGAPPRRRVGRRARARGRGPSVRGQPGEPPGGRVAQGVGRCRGRATVRRSSRPAPASDSGRSGPAGHGRARPGPRARPGTATAARRRRRPTRPR